MFRSSTRLYPHRFSYSQLRKFCWMLVVVLFLNILTSLDQFLYLVSFHTLTPISQDSCPCVTSEKKTLCRTILKINCRCVTVFEYHLQRIFFASRALEIRFLATFTALSTFPLLAGYRALDVRCWIPQDSQNFWKTYEANCGSLSEHRHGIPYWAECLLRHLITAMDTVLENWSTSQNPLE